MSSRRLAMRAFRSGPWQRKQVSDMMGRISRLKLTEGLSAAEINAGASAIRNGILRYSILLSRLTMIAPRIAQCYPGDPCPSADTPPRFPDEHTQSRQNRRSRFCGLCRHGICGDEGEHESRGI